MLWGHHKRLSMTATATRAVWHVPPPANEVNRRLIFIAAASRACVLSLAIVANLLLPDHKVSINGPSGALRDFLDMSLFWDGAYIRVRRDVHPLRLSLIIILPYMIACARDKV